MSASTGWWASVPAVGPAMTEICGTTPEILDRSRYSFADMPRDATPSFTLAPEESWIPMSGTPARSASSMTLMSFSPWVSPTVPSKTVASWENTHT